MNPKEELAAAISTLTDEETNQVIALAIQAGLMAEAPNSQAELKALAPRAGLHEGRLLV